MRLYSRTGAVALDDAEYGHFDANPDGGFDFPDDLSDRLHGFAVAGRPMWETDVERQQRLIAEELERRRDPATLMAAVQQLVNAAAGVAPQVVTPTPGPTPAPTEPVEPPTLEPAKAKRPTKRAAASPTE